MFGLNSQHRFFLYPEPCAMRKGFDGLSGIVSITMQKDILSGDVFIFINRPRNRMKLLQWQQGAFLKLERCFKLGEFEKLNQLSEFRELDHKSYIRFYKKNRFHKKTFLPVYKNYKNNVQNSVFDAFVKFRQKPIDCLTKFK